jgi:hypothetical protein
LLPAPEKIVLSSTSNFNNSGWGKSWILGLLIAAVLLGGLEYVWRINGHQPAIVDDQRLWALERSKAGKSPKEIVLLGSSRIQTDISIKTLHRLFPDYTIINLSADGTCANAVLFDLAADDNFTGKVILETTSECLLFGCDQDISQQFYVDYYHKTYNLNEKINRQIATLMQKNFVFIDPYLNLIKVAGNLIFKKKWRTPNYLKTHEDRTRAADYTKSNFSFQKTERIVHAEGRYKQLSSRITTQLLKRQIASMDGAIEKIILRGGKIVFVRFPVSDEHWNIDERYFPREFYWDTIIQGTRANVVHFKDIDAMNLLECPDTSHLDVRDKEKFTILLFKELLDRGAI